MYVCLPVYKYSISLAFGFRFGFVHAGKLVQYIHMYMRWQRVPSRLPCMHGISKNNTFSGHTSIRPNYAASLKYAFSAENSAGIICQTLVCLCETKITRPAVLLEEIMASHKPVNPFDPSALGAFSLSFCLSVCLSVCHVALKSL